MTALSTSYAVALVARVIGGMAAGMFWSLAALYAVALVVPEKAGRAVAVVFTGQAIALVGGVPLGTIIGSAFGWRVSFALLGAIAVSLAVAVRYLLPSLADQQAPPSVPMRSVIRIPGVAAIAATTTLLMFGHLALYTYIAPFLARAGLHQSAVGPVLLVFGLAGAVGVGMAGLFSDRDLRRTVLCLLTLLAASQLALAVAGRGAGYATTAIAAWGIAFGGLPSLMQAAMMRVPPEARQLAGALLSTAFNLGIGLGALVGGWLFGLFGVGCLPWVSAALVASSLVTALQARHAGFPARSLQPNT